MKNTLTFDNFFAPAAGYALFIVLAEWFQFVFVEADGANVTVEFQVVVQVQQSQVAFQVGWLKGWMDGDLADTHQVERFWFFVAAQFPFTALDENVVRTQAVYTMSGRSNEVFAEDSAAYFVLKIFEIKLSFDAQQQLQTCKARMCTYRKELISLIRVRSSPAMGIHRKQLRLEDFHVVVQSVDCRKTENVTVVFGIFLLLLLLIPWRQITVIDRHMI